MTSTDLDQPAELTVWPGTMKVTSAQSRAFRTLRAALGAAAKAIDADNAQTWIITEAGDILSPSWIRANMDLR